MTCNLDCDEFRNVKGLMLVHQQEARDLENERDEALARLALAKAQNEAMRASILRLYKQHGCMCSICIGALDAAGEMI